MTTEIQVPDPVATRWAHALHALATSKGSLDAVRQDIQLLAGEMRNPKVREFLAQSSLPEAQMLKLLAPVTDKLSPLTQNTVKLAVARRRAALLVGLPEAFQRKEDELSGVLQGVVESARDLGKPEIEQLEQSLTKRFGKKVVLRPRKNSELIGGVRVFVGAQMIDQSVQGRLDVLSRKMRSAPLV